MTANMAGALMGDLPYLEARRGGHRLWYEDTTVGDARNRSFDPSRVSTVSSGRADDFEALKQAALQGVRGRDRSHTVVLPGQQGEGVQVVDLKKLDRATQRSLMERVMRGGGEGDSSNAPLLQRMAQRLERVGLQPPTVTVRYQHLSVLSRMTVGDRSLPTLKKTVKRRAEPALRALGRGPPKAMFPIIDDVSGIIKPGVFTILLGPPGSGKSTFLQTLSGHNRKQRSLKFQAQELTFNGHQFQEFVVERSAAYISQNDLHYGELTVRETFDFAARCQATGYKQSLLEELLAREHQAGITPDPEVLLGWVALHWAWTAATSPLEVLDCAPTGHSMNRRTATLPSLPSDPFSHLQVDAYMRATSGPSKQNLIVEVIIKLLGLDVCADTVVGNAMLRGISGGQKKRVTTGEMAVGPIRALFADEISTGLDSNTTFQIARAFKHFCHVQRATMVVGLLQPQPETFDEFDEVILLSNGKVCFHGPCEMVLPFFEGQGFFCPPRRSIPDFLQEVTTPTDQGKYWDMRNGRPWHYVSALMVEAAFKRSEHWAGVAAELAQPFDRAADDTRALATDKYGQRYGWLLRTNFRRMLILQQRNKIFAIIRTTQVLLMSFVVSTLFWREDKNTVEDGNYFFGVIFYSVLYMLLGAISEMHLLVARLPVFYKQRDMNFYPGSCFAIPSFIMRVPWSFLEATIWTMLVYWLVSFSPSVRFLMWWLLLFLINLWSVALFQLIAAVCRDDTIATAVGSFFLLIFINLTGFVLNYSSIPGWWIWGYWANPFAWVTRALAINEFTSGHWMRPDPNNPSAYLGIEVLQFRGFPTEYWWCWASIGFLLGTMAICIGLFVAACTYLGAPAVRRVLTPEALQEFELSRKQLITPQPSVTEEAPQDAAERGAVAWPAAPPALGAGSKAPVAASDIQAGRAAAGNGPGVPGSAGGFKGTLGQAGATAGAPTSQDGTPSTARGAEMSAFSVAATAGTSFTEEPPSPGRRAYLMRASQRISHASQQAEAYKQRTALPFTPAVVTFTSVEYSVPLPPDADRSRADVPSEGPHSGNLRLLKGIDGAFRPGVLTALMGASGAGKTTLMDVLAGRKTEGHITGDIRVNGFPKDERTFARIMGYVEQTDIHIAQTTVAEALAFSAHLRLPTTVDAATRHAFVEEIMALVELTRLRHAYVGVPGVSGLSVEQRKRLTLAVELVANPAVVFMDEPTSGLDARAAGIVMDAVRATVDTGRTVVCTIHQPSIDIFEAFDELLLLKPGGATIYFGPLGDDSQRLIDYFQSIKGVSPCPERYNPANWMLEVTNPGNEGALGLDFADIYRGSALAKEMGAMVQQHVEPRPGTEPLQMSSLAAPGFRDQMLTNLRRNFIIYNRAPEYNLTRAITTILVAFCFGTMFWRQGDNRTTVAGVLNIMGVLFSSTLFLGISNCLTIQHLVAAQRTVFYRERAAGLYSVSAFSLAQLLVEVPYLVVQATVYVSMVYWMVWFARDAGKFFWFWFYFLLTLWYFTTLGIAAVNMTPSVPLSNVLCSFFFGFWNLLSGFLLPIPAMPGYWVWAAWINPVMWSIYGMSISQLGSFDNEYITNLQGVVQTIPAFLSDHFQFERYMTGIITAIMWAYILAFSALAAFALAKLNFQRR